MDKQTSRRDKILQNRQMFEYCLVARPQVLQIVYMIVYPLLFCFLYFFVLLFFFYLNSVRNKGCCCCWRIYLPNLSPFLNSFDSISGYNPQDAAGFIRINALR